MKIITLCFPRLIIRIFLLSVILNVSAIEFLHSQEKEGADEVNQPWNISSDLNYYTRYSRFGVDLSEDQPAVSLGSVISHENGLSGGVEIIAVTGSGGGYEQSAYHAGYAYTVSKVFTVSGIYTYHSYRDDTLSVLAGISNTVSIGGSLTAGSFHSFISYNAFFGGASADYLSGGASIQFSTGVLELEPSIQFCYASQTVSESLLPKNKAKGNNGKGNSGNGNGQIQGTITTLTTTITGISNLEIALACRYPLGGEFVASVTPSYQYTPTDLALRSSQFIVTIGIEHSIDF